MCHRWATLTSQITGPYTGNGLADTSGNSTIVHLEETDLAMEPVKTDLTVTHAVLTHTGLLREANEDDFAAVPEHGVYLVADGMGGHVAGQLASEICVQTVANFFGDEREDDSLVDVDGYTSLSPEALELAEALLLANQRIFERAAANPQLTGMGTTAVGIRITENRVAVSHAGDSRCYLFREGELAQVTVDHSLSNFLLALGRELEARYAEQTMSNVIMRALGLEREVAVDTKEFLVQAGDRLLLCSDGLSDLVSDEVIAAKLGEYGTSLDEIVSYLVDRALDAGGRDNITVLVVEIGGVTPPLPKSSFSETLELPASMVTGAPERVGDEEA
jgi:serine/threonine protein phosphatase PrpC